MIRKQQVGLKSPRGGGEVYGCSGDRCSFPFASVRAGFVGQNSSLEDEGDFNPERWRAGKADQTGGAVESHE